MAATLVPSLATLSARVTGYDYSKYHAYKTVVSLDGASWTLGIRYSTFLAFYNALRSADRRFKFAFPPKSGLFFTPKPEDRQVHLNAFLQHVLKYFQEKKQPQQIDKLLRQYLQVDTSYRQAKVVNNKIKEKEPVDEPQPEDKEKPKVPDNALTNAAEASSIKDNAIEELKTKDASNPKEIEDVKTDTKDVEEQEDQETNDDVSVNEVKLKGKGDAWEVVAIEQDVEEPVLGIEKTKDEESTSEATVVKIEDEESTSEATVVKIEDEESTSEATVVKIEDEESTSEERVVKIEDEESTSEERVVKIEETTTEEPTRIIKSEVANPKVKEDNGADVEHEEIKSIAASGTTTTKTEPDGTIILEKNVISQPQTNKVVVGKTVTIVSKSDKSHSFKVTMSEKGASVVTFLTSSKASESEEEKLKKKKRKKSISKRPASTSSDGFDSPDGVDDVTYFMKPRLSEAQKKARNQRRKEKRKKYQKKIQEA